MLQPVSGSVVSLDNACGVSNGKGCYYKCDADNTNCDFVITWKSRDTTSMDFTITGRVPGDGYWIAMGLSDDRIMVRKQG
jgi:hypothetical protein